MSSYLQRLLLTTWRKKSTILLTVILVVILLFGLQYSQSDGNKDEEKNEIYRSQMEALSQGDGNNVQFLNGGNLKSSNAPVKSGSTLDVEKLSKMEQPSREEIAARRAAQENNRQSNKDIEHQLGIPYVNLDVQSPYIPKQRIVHFDLKGAAPKVGFFRRVFTLIKNLGATGVLLEYEDMFPYDGILKNIKAKNAYTSEEIKEIVQHAEDLKLEVIPLIQTFGHVEFVLKHKEWTKLREVPTSPQALCPSRNSSLEFIAEVVKQILHAHPNSKFLHIGCDEVYQMGECELCRLELHETLFLKHIRNIASIVHRRWPKIQLIMWDDMLRHLTQQTMIDMKLGEIVEPMVWVYVEDIYRFVQPQIWEKYAAVFKTAWAASAFKGAFGETLIVPESKRHLENNLRWLEVMSQQSALFKRGFRGIALTGWQRYDHFAVLCELLPAGLPSLALSLLAVSNGYFNSSLKIPLLTYLSCPQQSSLRNSPFINLDADPYLWDKLGRCMFPGSPFFRFTYRLHSSESETHEFLRTTKRHKGWMTDYNVRHNYSLPLRVDELTADLPRVYHGVTSLIRSAVDSMVDIFDEYTIAEWIEQKIYPFMIELEKIQNQSVALKSVETWPPRPLPPLKELKKWGVPVP